MKYTIMFEYGERQYEAETLEDAMNLAHKDGNPIGIFDETERKLQEFDRLWKFISDSAMYIFLAFTVACFIAGFWKAHQFYLSGICLVIYLILKINRDGKPTR